MPTALRAAGRAASPQPATSTSDCPPAPAPDDPPGPMNQGKFLPPALAKPASRTARAPVVRAVTARIAWQNHSLSVFQPFSSRGETAIFSETAQVPISANPSVSPADEMAASTETLSLHWRCAGAVTLLLVSVVSRIPINQGYYINRG